MQTVKFDLDRRFTISLKEVKDGVEVTSRHESFYIYVEDPNAKSSELHPDYKYHRRLKEGLKVELSGLSNSQLQALALVLRSPSNCCDCHTFAILIRKADTLVPLISTGKLTIPSFHQLRYDQGVRTVIFPNDSIDQLLESSWDQIRYFVACNGDPGSWVHSFICLPLTAFNRPLILHKCGGFGMQLAEPASVAEWYEFDKLFEVANYDLSHILSKLEG